MAIVFFQWGFFSRWLVASFFLFYGVSFGKSVSITGVTSNGITATYSRDANAQGNFVYTLDGIGRRSDYQHGGGVVYPIGSNDLNQPANVSLPQELALHINAHPDADLWLNGTLITNQGGNFFHMSPVANFPQGGWYPWEILGVLEGQGEAGAGPDAKARVSGFAWVNPASDTYLHDADGNRESAPGWDYIWDGRNRMVGAQTKDYDNTLQGKKLKFEYDSVGRRVQKVSTNKVDGVKTTTTTIFVWSGWDLLYERRTQDDENGALLLERKYAWGADISGSRGGAGGAGGLLLYSETIGGTTTTYHPLYDGSGHVIALADAAGTLVAEYGWGPYGELIEASGSQASTNPWRYATKYLDEETGLYYFGHRYFDPHSGSWLSREPLGEGESLNLYAYCHNDPINKVDVLGLAALDITSEVASLNAQYEALSGFATRLGQDALKVDFTEEELIGALRQFRVDYASYASGVLDLQRRVFNNHITQHPIKAWWYRDQLNANSISAGRFSLSLPNDDLNRILGDIYTCAHEGSIRCNAARASSWSVIGQEARKIQGQFQTFKNYVDGAAMLTGIAGITKNVLAQGGIKAGSLYLAKTGGVISLSYAASTGVNYAIEEAVDRGYITEKGAFATRTGVTLLYYAIILRKMQSSAPGNVANVAAPGARVRVGGVNATELSGRMSPQQMAALQKEHGVEFAQIYVTGAGKNGGGGTYYLIQGTAGNAPIPVGPRVRLINHTHPTTLDGATVPLMASNEDYKVLRALQDAGSPQRRSQIVPEDASPFDFGR